MTESGPTPKATLWRESPRIDRENLISVLTGNGFDTNTIRGTDYFAGMRTIGSNIFPNNTAIDGQGVYIAGPVWLGVRGKDGEGLYTDNKQPPLPDCLIYRDGTKVCAFSPTQAYLDGAPNVLSMDCANLDIVGLVADFAEYEHHGLTMNLNKERLVLVEDIRDSDGNLLSAQPCVNKTSRVISLDTSNLEDAPPPQSPDKRWERRTLNCDIGNIFLGNMERTPPNVFLVNKNK